MKIDRHGREYIPSNQMLKNEQRSPSAHTYKPALLEHSRRLIGSAISNDSALACSILSLTFFLYSMRYCIGLSSYRLVMVDLQLPSSLTTTITQVTARVSSTTPVSNTPWF